MLRSESYHRKFQTKQNIIAIGFQVYAQVLIYFHAESEKKEETIPTIIKLPSQFHIKLHDFTKYHRNRNSVFIQKF